MMRIVSDKYGMIIDIPTDDVVNAAREAQVLLLQKQAEAWLANNHEFIRKALKQIIKTDLVRNNKKWL